MLDQEKVMELEILNKQGVDEGHCPRFGSSPQHRA